MADKALEIISMGNPADYGLDRRLGNLAVESGPGPNGGNAGFNSLELPSLHQRAASPSTDSVRPAQDSGSGSWRFGPTQQP